LNNKNEIQDDELNSRKTKEKTSNNNEESQYQNSNGSDFP
jgi:hypothetical protein